MIDGDFYDDTPWPGVTANPAEECVGDSLAPLTRERATGQRTGTTDQLWEHRIKDGECPRGSCSGLLDPDDCCPLCGWSLVEHRMRTRVAVREQPADFLPRLPGALNLLDEYAPADVDEAA